MGGFLDVFKNLLTNPSALQYIAAAGQDMLGNTPGKNLGGALQQQFGSNSMLKILQKMLSGNMPDGASIKTTGDTTTINVPHTPGEPHPILGGDAGVGEQKPITPTGQLTGGAGGNPVTGTLMNGIPGIGNIADIMRYLVPFGNDQSIKPSDLAGLGKEDILAAMGMKQNQQQLQQRGVAELADMLYRTGMLEQGASQQAMMAPHVAAQTELMKAQTMGEMMKIAEAIPTIDIPGVGKFNTTDYVRWLQATKDSLPSAVKEYEYAITNNGYKGSFLDFQNEAFTADQKNYRAAVAGGYDKDFNTWMIEKAKAGAMSIGDSVTRAAETAKALGGLKGQLLFKDPAALTKDIDSYLNEKSVRNEIADSDQPEQVRAEKKALRIRQLIETGVC